MKGGKNIFLTMVLYILLKGTYIYSEFIII